MAATPRRARSPRSPAAGGELRDDTALRQAYNAHGAELFRFALRQLGDAGAAEDAVQDTFVRAWSNAERFDPEVADLRVWLFAIMRNVVIDEGRRSAVRPWHRPVEVHDSSAAALGGPPRSFEDELVHSWLVEEALRRLAPEHRTVIVDVHLRGRPQAEVAAELDIPVGTVRSRVFYALKALRLAMEEMGVQP